MAGRSRPRPQLHPQVEDRPGGVQANRRRVSRLQEVGEGADRLDPGGGEHGRGAGEHLVPQLLGARLEGGVLQPAVDGRGADPRLLGGLLGGQAAGQREHQRVVGLAGLTHRVPPNGGVE